MAIFKESKARTSIVVTLTLLFVCIGVIPLLISTWRIITINKEELESNLQETFVITVESVSAEMAKYLTSYREQMQQYVPAALADLRGSNSKQAAGVLPTLMKDVNFLKVRLLSPDGKGPYAQRYDFQDPNVAKLESQAFEAALAGNSALSNVYYDPTIGIPVLAMAEPLKNDADKVIGALSAVISLQELYRMVNDRSTSGRVVYVVDHSGNLLLHPDKTQMKERRSLAASSLVGDYMKAGRRISTVRVFEEKIGDRTVEILGAYSSIAGTDWGVLIQIERGTAFQAVRKMIGSSMQLGILFALAAAGIGIFLARWITDPIKKLAQHALSIGRDQNFDQKIRIDGSNEIQQLADTFNYMTEEIKQYVLQLQAAVRENKELFISSIRMLSAAIDAKDPYTRGHSERVKEYTMVIARTMGLKPFELERLEIAALLHDVGKIGIEDRILRKPTNLTAEEFDIMKTHPDKGASIMGQVKQLADIIPGMRGHHENYDGSGYPQGLKGEEIHLFARIITVADTFDAMTTDRPYQKAFTLEFALNRIRQMASIKYDPRIVEAFGRACEEGKITLHKPSRPRPKQPVA